MFYIGFDLLDSSWRKKSVSEVSVALSTKLIPLLLLNCLTRAQEKT